jgi:hypothetical protein
MSEEGRKSRRQRRVRGGSPLRVNVRTTPETHTRLAADAAGLSIPRFLVESALRRSSGGWSLREQRWWAERLDAVETRLIRIGTNLNQMAAATNSTGELPQELLGALRYVEETLDRHREVLAAINPADRSRR